MRKFSSNKTVLREWILITNVNVLMTRPGLAVHEGKRKKMKNDYFWNSQDYKKLERRPSRDTVFTCILDK